MIRVLKLGILSVLLALLFQVQNVPAQDAKKIKIGFSIEAMNGERWQTDLDSFEVTAKKLGAEVISFDAKGQDDLQFTQVKEMIKSGIDVLVLLPRDTTTAGRMVEAAKAANVKVISYDRLILNSDVDLYVSFNRAEIGKMQAEYLVKHAPKGNYVLIAGSPNDEGAKVLHDAQMTILQPYIDRGDIRVIADEFMKDWSPTEAYLFAPGRPSILRKAISLPSWLPTMDSMASGAIEALRDRNLNGKVLVTGERCRSSGSVCIAGYTQAMTVYKPIPAEAALQPEKRFAWRKMKSHEQTGR